jgi:hypothetical protein
LTLLIPVLPEGFVYFSWLKSCPYTDVDQDIPLVEAHIAPGAAGGANSDMNAANDDPDFDDDDDDNDHADDDDDDDDSFGDELPGIEDAPTPDFDRAKREEIFGGDIVFDPNEEHDRHDFIGPNYVSISTDPSLSFTKADVVCQGKVNERFTQPKKPQDYLDSRRYEIIPVDVTESKFYVRTSIPELDISLPGASAAKDKTHLAKATISGELKSGGQLLKNTVYSLEVRYECLKAGAVPFSIHVPLQNPDKTNAGTVAFRVVKLCGGHVAKEGFYWTANKILFLVSLLMIAVGTGVLYSLLQGSNTAQFLKGRKHRDVPANAEEVQSLTNDVETN